MGDLKQKLRNNKKLVILLSVVSILIIVVVIITYNLQFLNVYMKVIITVQRKYTALIKIMKILKTI